MALAKTRAMTTKKTVLVTGATRGIGLAFAAHYAARGWNVIGAARDLHTAEQLQKLPLYKLVRLDVGDEVSVLRAAEQLADEPIDLLVNNAGIFIRADMAATTKPDLMRTFEVNAVGPFLVARAFVPHLKAAVAARGDSAAIVQISSLLGSIKRNTSGGSYSYRASKAALNMLNASLAADLQRDNIAAFAFHPGFVATDINEYRGTISTDESVQGLMRVIESLSMEDTGKFFDWNGERLPW